MNRSFTNTTRRNFLKMSTVAGALILSCPLRTFAQITGNVYPEMLEADLGIFIKISTDNKITIGSPIPDMGQGVSTAVPILLAEEFDVDWNDVTVEKLKPYVTMRDGRVEESHTFQNAGGSQSIREVWLAMREAGAIARNQILAAAAQQMGVTINQLTSKNGFVYHSQTGTKMSYGSLVEVASKLPMSQNIPPLKSPDQFTIIGKDIKNEASHNIVRGIPTFGLDMKVAGMRHAMIKRSPYSEGSVERFNQSQIESMPGIITTVILGRIPDELTEYRIMSTGVAVIGRSFWEVKKAYDALEVVWNTGPNAHKSNEWIDRQFDDVLSDDAFDTLYQSGEPDGVMVEADNIIEATYENPYWAHVCMEPHNCIANVTETNAQVIVGHQTTARVARVTKAITGLEIDKIDVKICRMGTGLGRKSHRDFIYEAVMLSNMLKEPIKVTWTREDEIEQDYFNPKARHVLKAAINDSGSIDAMTYSLLCADNNPIAAHAFPAHCIDNFRYEMAVVEGLQTGPWRGPMENITGFTNQSFLDEIAVATNQDPYDFRVKLLSGKGKAQYDTWDNLPVDHDRLLGVLNLAAEKADWQNPDLRKPGMGRGIACHFTFGGYAAWVVDVRVDDDGSLHILKATGAIDCGTVVNRLGVKAQMEGGALDGFSAALNQSVDYRNGQVYSNNYDSYIMARLADLEPEMDVHIVKSIEHPTGAGEIGLPPAIPALLNAIYDACGIRIRRLPIADQLRER
tara:strand:- start:49014 stop:51230 length:2217 start_codon:yes stop_codon:yes gene_type:complete